MKISKKVSCALSLAFIFSVYFAAVALGEDVVQIDAGLQSADKTVLANKLKDIFIGIGYFIGVVAVGSLIFNAFRLATATQEQKRAEVQANLLWTLGAVVLVALALMIVGFIISLVGGSA